MNKEISEFNYILSLGKRAFNAGVSCSDNPYIEEHRRVTWHAGWIQGYELENKEDEE